MAESMRERYQRSYNFGDAREETYEECVIRLASVRGTSFDEECNGKPRQIKPLPEEDVQYYLNNPEQAMPGRMAGQSLNDYVENNQG